MRLSLFVLIFISCAHKVPEKSNVPGILNLAKTSYIRGCIDGMNKIQPMLTNGVRLTYCKVQASLHAREVEMILNAPSPDESEEAQRN